MVSTSDDGILAEYMVAEGPLVQLGRLAIGLDRLARLAVQKLGPSSQDQSGHLGERLRALGPVAQQGLVVARQPHRLGFAPHAGRVAPPGQGLAARVAAHEGGRE